MRPPVHARIAAVTAGVSLSAITAALGAEMSGWLVALGVLEAAFVGLLFNAARHQGAWLLDGHLVLETAFGRSVVPLERVVAVHVDDPLTTMGVDAGPRYVVMSIGSPAGPRTAAGSIEHATALLADRDIRVVRHDSATAVRAVRTASAPWHSVRAIVDTARRPLVAGTVIVGAIFAVLQSSNAS